MKFDKEYCLVFESQGKIRVEGEEGGGQGWAGDGYFGVENFW